MQVIAVKEQCLNFSNDSMLFLINFRDSKKRGTDHGPTDGPTDGRTDRPSYRDAWTHLKRQVACCLSHGYIGQHGEPSPTKRNERLLLSRLSQLASKAEFFRDKMQNNRLQKYGFRIVRCSVKKFNFLYIVPAN